MASETEPRAERPHMPGYGIAPAGDGGSGLLPWSWADERLARSHDYWIASTWPDGRPHVMPVWGCWLDGAVWFSSSGRSRKARNLRHDPRVSVTTDDARQPVVIEGAAVELDPARERPAFEGFAAATHAKYGGDYDVEFFLANALFRVAPQVAFGLDDDEFTTTPTRWSFASPAP